MTRTHANAGVEQAPTPFGGLLIHPVSIGLLTILVANDFVIKAHWPGMVSGKLSDLVGLAWFPILLWAAADVLLGYGFGRRAGHVILWIGAAATGVAFTMLKLTDFGSEVYASTFSLLLAIPYSLTGGVPPQVGAVQDASDLLALPMLAVPIVLFSRQGGSEKST